MSSIMLLIVGSTGIPMKLLFNIMDADHSNRLIIEISGIETISLDDVYNFIVHPKSLNEFSTSVLSSAERGLLLSK